MGIQVLPTQGSISGRIGAALGRGLSESLPKEVERYRLSQGLKGLGQKKNLSPYEQFAELSSVPGITPQMIQSGSELLKQQGIRGSYKNKGKGEPRNQPSSPKLDQVDFANLQSMRDQNNQSDQTVPSDLSRREEATSNPGAANENPLSEKFVPAAPWNQERQENAINEAFDRGVATNFNEAEAYANNQRELYENAPEKYRKQLDYKKGVDNEVDDLFDKQMQTRIQKSGTDTFKDLNGDLQLNLKKQARNSVATGKMTPAQAAEYYSKKALDLVKDKGRVLEIANRDVLDRVLPNKKEEALKNLMHISKTFEDLGSSEDYYNLLKTDKLDGKGIQQGLGLSPGGASMIAYPRTEKVKDLIRKTKISASNNQQGNGNRKSKISPSNSAEGTRRFAEDLFNVMTPKDSFLAIARQMKQQDPNFDEYAFFDYLRENQDKYGSNSRLNREVNQGVSDFFPNWRDVGLFPAFTKSVAND